MTEKQHFKALTKSDQTSAIADHMKTTGHNSKWDHFDILASGTENGLSLWNKGDFVDSRTTTMFEC